MWPYYIYLLLRVCLYIIYLIFPAGLTGKCVYIAIYRVVILNSAHYSHNLEE